MFGNRIRPVLRKLGLFTAVVQANNEALSRRLWNGTLWSIPLETHRKATSEQLSPHYADLDHERHNPTATPVPFNLQEVPRTK
jgi:hypothetical protein|tara:strand:+ start:11777 stop:12025 length:249 start_codon:yes stop_codon:yes gene_type:complete